MKGTIKSGTNTKNHAATLRHLGFNAEEKDGVITVEAERILGAVVITEAGIKETVKAKGLLSYQTRVTCTDGKTRFGIPLCCYLGPISAVVVSGEKAVKVPAAKSALAAELGL